MLRKLWPRMIVSHTLPIIIVLPVVSLVLLYFVEARFSLGNVADQLIAQGTLIKEFTQDNEQTWLDSRAADRVIDRVKPYLSARMMLLDNSGRLLASSLPNDQSRIGQVISFPVVQQALTKQTNWQLDYSPYMVTRILDMGLPVLNNEGEILGIVRLSYDISAFEQRAIPYRWLILFTVLIGVSVALILGILLARSLSFPLAQLTRAVQHLSPGLPPITLSGSGPYEVKALAFSFSKMTERLHILEKKRQQLLTNIVHELASPLGAIKAAAQAMENGALSDPQIASDLALGISSQVDQLRLLIDDLALLGETEVRALVIKPQPVDLSDLIQSQCQSYAWLLSQKRISLMCELPTHPLLVNGEASRIRQILANLLHNAYKFTPPRGEICIDAVTEADFVKVTVRDTGPGIDATELKDIFELHYRNAEQRNTQQGMGIGLALSRQIAEAHGGTLTVSSKKNPGAALVLTLPMIHQN